jgi:hypothetical protein
VGFGSEVNEVLNRKKLMQGGEARAEARLGLATQPLGFHMQNKPGVQESGVQPHKGFRDSQRAVIRRIQNILGPRFKNGDHPGHIEMRGNFPHQKHSIDNV